MWYFYFQLRKGKGVKMIAFVWSQSPYPFTSEEQILYPVAAAIFILAVSGIFIWLHRRQVAEKNQ